MNNEKEVRNFYEAEEEYEKSILITKELIGKVISCDFNILKDKIKSLDTENKYGEFIDLLIAVIGRKTNKYYYCTNVEDTKYYNLEEGKVYKMSQVGLDIKNNNLTEKALDLQARAQLAPILLILTRELKHVFSLNISSSDETLYSMNTDIILNKDIEYLNDLENYLELIIDKTGRLKILVSEKDIYSLEKAKNEYSKKSSFAKTFYKIFGGEKKAIESLAKRNK